jgi:hypothetical protein
MSRREVPNIYTDLSHTYDYLGLLKEPKNIIPKDSPVDSWIFWKNRPKSSKSSP